MTKPGNWLQAAPLAVVALALLAPPTVAAAQTDAPSNQTKAAAKNHPKKHVATTGQPHHSADPYGCTWPYQNRFPPCMSTWPEGSPSYHGSRPGVTFDDER